jgi:hypothetical protein
MLTFILEQFWLVGILVWVMIGYILYGLFTDHPDSK